MAIRPVVLRCGNTFTFFAFFPKDAAEYSPGFPTEVYTVVFQMSICLVCLKEVSIEDAAITGDLLHQGQIELRVRHSTGTSHSAGSEVSKGTFPRTNFLQTSVGS